MITVVDFGLGNIGSLRSMFKHLRVDVLVSSDPRQICKASKLVLPGVGSFGEGMRRLLSIQNMSSALAEAVRGNEVPILGICLGMQIMFSSSEEDDEVGLDWIKARVQRFPASAHFKVPNMGWGHVEKRSQSSLTTSITETAKFYFVHSYYIPVDAPVSTSLIANHGVDFVAAFQVENIFGVQFHPEKSHRHGMTILQNFAEM